MNLLVRINLWNELGERNKQIFSAMCWSPWLAKISSIFVCFYHMESSKQSLNFLGSRWSFDLKVKSVKKCRFSKSFTNWKRKYIFEYMNCNFSNQLIYGWIFFWFPKTFHQFYDFLVPFFHCNSIGGFVFMISWSRKLIVPVWKQSFHKFKLSMFNGNTCMHWRSTE